MKKLACHVKNVAKGLLFLGFCVQIGFGLIWTFQNIGKEPMFAPMQIGILNQYDAFIYVVQLLCAFLAYYAFLMVIRRGKDAKWLCAFGALALLTIPSVLQCHLSLLPYSVMSTTLVVWFTLVVWWLREKRAKYKMVIGVILSIVVMHVVCMMPVRTGVETAISGDEPVLVSLVSRVAWPFLQADYYNMPQEIKNWVDSDIVVSATVHGDGVASVLYPTIVERYGEDAAKQACMDVIGYELGFNTRKIVEYVAQDFVLYHVPAIANYLHLEGYGYGSMASRNYACFSMYSPMIANWYVTYWAVSFVLFAVATVITWLLEERKILWHYVIMFGVPIEYAIVLLTMQGAGLMDYKKVLFVTLITYSVMFMALLPKRGETVE